MFTSKVYSMNSNGQMEEHTPVPTLPIGCKIHINGLGSASIGCVISAPNEHGAYKCVTCSEFGENKFFTLDKYCRPWSKKFGIGYYWDDAMEIIDEDVMNAHILAATWETESRAEKAKAEADAYAAEKAALPAKYPHLKPITERYNKAQAKANLVGQLANAFPRVKFSVKNSHGYTYNIAWTNGPTLDEMKNVLNLFKDSYFDGMTDSTVHYKNAFADVFGSFDYLFTHRDPSDEIVKIIEGNAHLSGDRRNPFRDAFDKQSFPAGATITGFDDDAFCYTFTAPEQQPVSTESYQAVNRDGVSIEEYSEKAIVVRGITKDDTATHVIFREIGGVFNFRLKGGAGWIFSKRHAEAVKNALGLHHTGITKDAVDQGGQMMDAQLDQANDAWAAANL